MAAEAEIYNVVQGVAANMSVRKREGEMIEMVMWGIEPYTWLLL